MALGKFKLTFFSVNLYLFVLPTNYHTFLIIIIKIIYTTETLNKLKHDK